MSAIALILSTSTASSAHGEKPDDAPQWDQIAFEIKSWGAPVRQWQYTPDYGGSWVSTKRKEGTDPQVWTRSYHTIEADADRFAALQRIVERMPEPAPDTSNCQDIMTDQPYGTIRMKRGATTVEVAFDASCLDDDYVAFLDILRDADRLVTGWGKDVPATRTEDTRTP